MKIIIPLLISLAAFFPVAATNIYENYEVYVSPASGSWSAEPGQDVKFNIEVKSFNLPVGDDEITYYVSEDMMPARKTGRLKLKNGKAVIDGGTMKAPGFLRCEAYITVDGRTYKGFGTVGFSPEKLKPVTEYPSDFDDFWAAKLEQARGCDISPKMVLQSELCTSKVDVYRVSFAVCHPDTRIYGMLGIPKGGGKFPAVVCYPGAGVHPQTNAFMEVAERGIITLSIGIHGIRTDLDPQIYKDLDWGALQGYQTSKMHSRDDYYYRRVIQGAVRAVDFVESLPQCNGCIATYGGSQGGFLSIAVASLHPSVDYLVAHFPAMSDLAGYLHGRAGGWPHMLRDERNRCPEFISTLRYFDTANFARGIKVPGFYTFGFTLQKEEEYQYIERIA